MAIELDDNHLRTASVAVKTLPEDVLAAYVAELIRRAGDRRTLWLPIITRPNAAIRIEVRGVLHPEANSDGRLEMTHWRPLPGDMEEL